MKNLSFTASPADLGVKDASAEGSQQRIDAGCGRNAAAAWGTEAGACSREADSRHESEAEQEVGEPDLALFAMRGSRDPFPESEMLMLMGNEGVRGHGRHYEGRAEREDGPWYPGRTGLHAHSIHDFRVPARPGRCYTGVMSSRRNAKKIAVTIALMLFVSLLAAADARPFSRFWQDLATDPSVRDWNPKPPITDLRSAVLPVGGTALAGAVSAHLEFDPPKPVAGEKTSAVWRFTDRLGRPIDLDRTMHNIPLHVYAVREDVLGEVVHMHPVRQGDSADWHDTIVFPYSGHWRMDTQGPDDGTLYEFTTAFDVDSGDEKALPSADDAKKRTMMQYEVELVDFPARIDPGKPARLHFKVRHTPEIPRRTAVDNARAHHNLIIAHAGSGGIWNHHGDGSVDAIGAKAAVAVTRKFTPEDPFDYTVTFPEPGTWLIDFEYLGESAQFWIKVQEPFTVTGL